MTAAMPSPVRASAGFAVWVGAARVRTLPAAVAPVVVGIACASVVGAVAWPAVAAALIAALLIQIGTNFANDVFDNDRGADTPDRKGPVRAVAAGLISSSSMRRAMVIAFALATLVGGYLALIAGWPIIAIGVASIAAGVLYTGGPWPLGYHGLGDVFVWLFFGPVAVCGATYVACGRVTLLASELAISVGAIATAVLVVNNLRDRVTDARVGKRTLAVRWGRGVALVEYGGLLAIAHAVPVVIALTGRPWVAIATLTAPLAWLRTKQLIAAEPGPRMNQLLAKTAQLLLAQSTLIAIGVIASR
jgi:1,4-dihydroxy-2-naphthoate polyprenyltransferase